MAGEELEVTADDVDVVLDNQRPGDGSQVEFRVTQGQRRLLSKAFEVSIKHLPAQEVSGCPHCAEELGALSEAVQFESCVDSRAHEEHALKRQFGDQFQKGLEVVAVITDATDARQDMVSICPIEAPVVVDEHFRLALLDLDHNLVQELVALEPSCCEKPCLVLNEFKHDLVEHVLVGRYLCLRISAQ